MLKTSAELEPGLQDTSFICCGTYVHRKRPREGTVECVRMEDSRLLVSPRAGNRDAICLHLSHRPLSHAQVRAVAHQVINTDPGDTDADIKHHCFWFRLQVPKGVRICSRPWESTRGRTLTLGTDGPLPAFFADACEGLAIDHAGAPIMAGAGQTATVSGCKTGTRPPTVRTQKLSGRAGPRPSSSPTDTWQGKSYLCCRSFLPSPQDTCT